MYDQNKQKEMDLEREETFSIVLKIRKHKWKL